MPGMIVRLKKQAGDSVREGETVVAPAAMKSGNVLTAPATGTIK